MFSFGGLFQAILLLVNAVAVLSEDRFLARSAYLPPVRMTSFILTSC